VTGGEATLQILRLPAQEGPKLGTMLLVAGGPGQSSTMVLIELAEFFRGANRYDIVAIDPRGTGFSQPLNCLSLERARTWDGADAKTDKPITDCASDIGAARATYTTQESAADIESVRDALGVEQLTLFGVSYGTKLAMAYAATHPGRVAGLLLDSVLPVNSPDPLDTVSTAAMRRSLEQICAGRNCGFTRDPAGDVNKLARRLAASPVRGEVLIPGLFPEDEPELVNLKVTPTSLYETFYAADFNSFIYEQLPAAVESSLHGDDAMLLRMQAIAGISGLVQAARRNRFEKRVGTRPRATAFSDSLYFATTCEDLASPWPRGAALGSRQGAIDAAAAAVPDTDYLPFDRTTVKNNSTATFCRGWPEAVDQPVLPTALPDVPALVLNGSLDVRTPTSWARSAVAGMPRAQVIEIPNVGHSVTGMDISECALSLARRFLIYRTTSGRCRTTTPAVPVQDPAPLTVGSVKPMRGSCTRVGNSRRCRAARKSVTAAYLAVRDAMDQWVIGGNPFGIGLRSGSYGLGGPLFDLLLDEEMGLRDRTIDPTYQGLIDSLDLDFYSHVLGVTVDGRFRFPRYPRAGGKLTMNDQNGRRWRISFSGFLGYNMRDDQLKVTARSGRRVVRIGPLSRSSAARKSRITRPSSLRHPFGATSRRP
jgi:pimeloyl-ACP methyl ester carboxylesterase